MRDIWLAVRNDDDALGDSVAWIYMPVGKRNYARWRLMGGEVTFRDTIAGPIVQNPHWTYTKYEGDSR